MKKLLKYFSFALISFQLFFSCSKPIEADLVISNVNIIDVKTGTINSNMDVFIDGETITSIIEYKNKTNYKSENIIDATDKFLIPGLWDMHTHTWANYKDFFPLLLANGVTGVREMFGDLETVKRIRIEIKNGDIIGPMIYSSGLIVDGKPPVWSGSDVADTPAKGREIVRKQIAYGAEFIKVYDALEKDVYFAIADECKKQGIPLNGHIPEKISLKEAIEVGHQCVEHFYGILEYASGLFEPKVLDSLTATGFDITKFSNRSSYFLENQNEVNTQETIQLLTNNNTWVSPTLMVHSGYIKYMDPTTPLDDRLNYMPDNAINDWGLEPWEPNEEEKNNLKVSKLFYSKMTALIKKLHVNNVRFLAGTDYSNPHTYPGFSLHDELKAFVEDCGFTSLEALQAATINPAVFMNKESSIGTVEIGKLANLVMLNKNPLEDINNVKSIDAVLVSGQYLEGEMLRNNIEAIAIENRKPKIKDVVLEKIENEGIEQAIAEYHKLKRNQPDVYNFTVGQLNGLGYQLLRKKKLSEAIVVFKLNTEMFPEDANAYDSLGDAYVANNDTINAIKAYKTAVKKGFNVSKPKLESLKND